MVFYISLGVISIQFDVTNNRYVKAHQTIINQINKYKNKPISDKTKYLSVSVFNFICNPYKRSRENYIYLKWEKVFVTWTTNEIYEFRRKFFYMLCLYNNFSFWCSVEGQMVFIGITFYCVFCNWDKNGALI